MDDVPQIWSKPENSCPWNWYLGMWICAIGALGAALLMVLDPRTLSGELIWAKPLKFMISVSVFCLSIDWITRFVRFTDKRAQQSLKCISLGLLLELILISVQASRGVKSHFNQTDPRNFVIFLVMGITIIAVTAAACYLSWRVFKTKSLPKPWREMVLLGLGFSCISSAISGQLMIVPTARQLSEMNTESGPSFFGSHSVGAEDGTTKAFHLTGWSVEVGDMRVPHFIGIHMFQILMAFVFLSTGSTRPATDLTIENMSRLVRQQRLVFALGATLFGSSCMQALSGQTFFKSEGYYFTANAMATIGLIVLLATAGANGQYAKSKYQKD